MPVYEITWRFQASSDENALEVFKTAQNILPEVSVSLKKVLDE